MRDKENDVVETIAAPAGSRGRRASTSILETSTVENEPRRSPRLVKKSMSRTGEVGALPAIPEEQTKESRARQLKRRKSVTFGVPEMRTFEKDTMTVDLGPTASGVLKAQHHYVNKRQTGPNLATLADDYSEEDDTQMSGATEDMELTGDVPTSSNHGAQLQRLLLSADSESDEELELRQQPVDGHDSDDSSSMDTATRSVTLPFELQAKLDSMGEQDLSLSDSIMEKLAAASHSLELEDEAFSRGIDQLLASTPGPDGEETGNLTMRFGDQLRQILAGGEEEEQSNPPTLNASENTAEHIKAIHSILKPEEEAPQEEDIDVDAVLADTSIEMKEFYDATKVKFLANISSRKTGSLCLPAASDTYSEDSLRDRLYLFCTDNAELDLVREGCGQLESVVEQLTEGVAEVEQCLQDEAPSLVRQALAFKRVAEEEGSASEIAQKRLATLQQELKTLKSISKTASRIKWYQWKATLMKRLQENMQDSLMGLEAETGKLELVLNKMEHIETCLERAQTPSLRRLKQNVIDMAKTLGELHTIQRSRQDKCARISEEQHALTTEAGSLTNALAEYAADANMYAQLQKQLQQQIQEHNFLEDAVGLRIQASTRDPLCCRYTLQPGSHYEVILEMDMSGSKLLRVAFEATTQNDDFDALRQHLLTTSDLNATLEAACASGSWSEVLQSFKSAKCTVGRWSDLLEELQHLSSTYSIFVTVGDVTHVRVYLTSTQGSPKQVTLDLRVDWGYPFSALKHDAKIIKGRSRSLQVSSLQHLMDQVQGFDALTRICHKVSSFLAEAQ